MSVPYSDTSHQSPAEVLDGSSIRPPQKVVDVFPVVEWLRNLGLSKYEDVFVREEIDWDTLQCLTDEVTFFILFFIFSLSDKYWRQCLYWPKFGSCFSMLVCRTKFNLAVVTPIRHGRIDEFFWNIYF